MAGALQRASTRGRRGFADGGSADPMADVSGGTNPADATGLPLSVALALQNPSGGPPAQGAPQPGALSQAPDISGTPPTLGALSRNSDPAQADKLASMQRAMSVLQAGGVGQGPGSSNLPLLAAAGALLGPTRTGTFGESLGSAMTAGASEAEKQREMMENAALRMQQAQMNNDYRQQMAAAATSRAQSYGQNADTNAEKADNQEILNQARIGNMTQIAALRALNSQTSADAGTWTAARGKDADGNEVPGMAFASKTGGAPVFYPITTEKSVATDNAAANNTAKASALEAYRHAKLAQGDMTAQQTAQWHDYMKSKGATDQDIRIMEGSKDPITGAAGLTPKQANEQGNTIRGQNTGDAKPAPVIPTVPSIPTGVPPGSAYSPSRQMWRDPTGNLFDSAGQPVGTR